MKKNKKHKTRCVSIISFDDFQAKLQTNKNPQKSVRQNHINNILAEKNYSRWHLNQSVGVLLEF